MNRLNIEDVKLHAKASDKKNAVILTGKLMEKNGYVVNEYTESMLMREEITSTYVGNGIAIPHGKLEDTEMIKKTGVVVLQFPEGVVWDKDNTVYIVVGIAAKSDEHIQILSNLTSIIQDRGTAESFRYTDDPMLVIKTLAEERNLNTVEINADDIKTRFEMVVKNPLGLHIRAASLLVDFARQKTAEIYIEHNGKIANCKSLMSILTLGVDKDDLITVYVKDDDGNIAQEVRDFIDKSLVDLVLETEKIKDRVNPNSYKYASTNIIKGIPVSGGTTIAPVFIYDRELKKGEIEFTSIETEWNIFKKAILTSKKELAAIFYDATKSPMKHYANIIKAQINILEDEMIIRDVFHKIKQHCTAEKAWTEIIDNNIEELGKTESYIAARRIDLQDLKTRVIKNFSVDSLPDLKDLREPSIIIAKDLFPSDIIAMDRSKIAGLCTAYGGVNSHMALLAKSLSIPVLVACGEAVLSVKSGKNVILDAIKGALVLEPANEDIETAKIIQEQLQEIKIKEESEALEPAITLDRKRVDVLANISFQEDVYKAMECGAEGVGLLRTEFLYINRNSPPTEEEQFITYTRIAETLKGLPLAIRLLDVGGDKPIEYINLDVENNPFLGLRGIRLLLHHKDLLVNQLKAIVKASTIYHIKLLIPMVTFIDELEEFFLILNKIKNDFGPSKLKIGIMVEVPSTAILTDFFMDKTDFVCIGTNDLTQYTLAIDRTHAKLASRLDHLHPAVLKLINHVVSIAHNNNKTVCLCGLLASDTYAIPILIGLGVDELSIDLQSVSAIKYKIRQLSYRDCQELSKIALKCSSSGEIRNISNAFLQK